MKKLTVAFGVFLTLSSCSHNKPENSLTSQRNQKTEPELINKNDSNKFQNAGNITDSVTGITSLPFGFQSNKRNFDVALNFFNRLLYSDKNLPFVHGFPKHESKEMAINSLPDIKSIKYIAQPMGVIDNDNEDFSTHIKLKGYRYRLPDLDKFQVYYWCGNGFDFQKSYTDEEWELCKSFMIDGNYGYLIFYDPSNKLAKVTTIFLDAYNDGSQAYRFFYIDKHYNVYLFENGGNLEYNFARPDVEFRSKIMSLKPDGSIVMDGKTY